VDGSRIIGDYLNKTTDYGQNPGIEVKIERLGTLIARIADAANINLLDIIGKYEIKGDYSVDNSPDTD
jgi:hypothetical protein